jgi:hypothetical protein
MTDDMGDVHDGIADGFVWMEIGRGMMLALPAFESETARYFGGFRVIPRDGAGVDLRPTASPFVGR